MMFQRLLVANRGEVAVRIIRAAKSLGIHTVAIHSEADAGAMWTRLADECHDVGPAPARASYLNIERIIEVARTCGAQTVHPGYGLLSENSDFAQAVVDAGLRFIGPSAAVIALMGDKVTARACAVACDVPVLAGSDGPVTDAADALRIAERIGWPVAVKASFGGGGRGMRVAHSAAELANAMQQASREASSAFGRGEIFLERFLSRPRHVEVQVLGDDAGNLIVLGERDCSVQRRHQKLLEEAPASTISDELRARLAQAAERLCRSVRYSNAGTVEFLVDPATQEFYFLEMNTRLQVEHGITELVTGIDIVAQQIRIAAGERIGFSQADVRVDGHAIQARIAAEEPWQGFQPCAGRIEEMTLPLGPWLRLDFGFATGDVVPAHYDSMLGKIHAWGRTREEARMRISKALDAFRIAGVPTTAPYLRTVLERESYIEGTHDTGSLERDWLPSGNDAPAAQPAKTPAHTVPGARQAERRVTVPWGADQISVAIYGTSDPSSSNGDGSSFASATLRQTADASPTGDGSIRAPMDAVVIAHMATVGARVSKGEPVLVLEAMKMELVVRASHDGTLHEYLVAPGDAVKSGAVLASIHAMPDSAGDTP